MKNDKLGGLFFILFAILLFVFIYFILPTIMTEKDHKKISQDQRIVDGLIAECTGGCRLASDIIDDFEVLWGGDCWYICEEDIMNRPYWKEKSVSVSYELNDYEINILRCMKEINSSLVDFTYRANTEEEVLERIEDFKVLHEKCEDVVNARRGEEDE